MCVSRCRTIYPIPEESGAALLLNGGNLFGIVFVFAMTAMIPKGCTTVVTPIAIMLVSVFVVAGIGILSFKKSYKCVPAPCSPQPVCCPGFLCILVRATVTMTCRSYCEE